MTHGAKSGTSLVLPQESPAIATSSPTPYAFDFGLSRIWKRPPRLGLYVHVPFCPHICPYCDFLKTDRFNATQIKAFLEGVRAQWELLSPWWEEAPADLETTLYFGGGTPSLLSPEIIAELIALVRTRTRPSEVTLESNPFTNRPRALERLRAAGVNRLTLGSQSLSPDALTLLGRKHSPKMVLESLEAARSAGFAEVQADLIYGLKPGVRGLGVTREIEMLVACGATGISAYALSLEAGTAFAGTDFADDAEAAREYGEIVSACTGSHGMTRWETSNFSAREPRHNQTYWMGFPYLAFGAGAHGLTPGCADAPLGTRFRVGPERPGKRAPGNADLDFTRDFSLAQLHFDPPRTPAEARLEFLYTAPRTCAGLPRAWLQAQCDEAAFLSQPEIRAGIEDGKLKLTASALHLTDEERLFGDRWTLRYSEAMDAAIADASPSLRPYR